MRRAVTTISKYSTDPNLVLNLPLFETGLKENIFASYDIYAHKCSVIGATWGSQGRTFNGVDNQITVPNSSVFTMTAGYTLEVWIKLTDLANYNMLITKGNSPDGLDDQFQWRIDQTSGAMYATVVNNVGAAVTISSSAVSEGVWHQLVLSYDTHNLRTYADAVLNGGPIACTLVPLTNTHDLWIGNWEGSANWLKALLGSARIYNLALSAPEILQSYQSTKWRYGV